MIEEELEIKKWHCLVSFSVGLLDVWCVSICFSRWGISPCGGRSRWFPIFTLFLCFSLFLKFFYIFLRSDWSVCIRFGFVSSLLYIFVFNSQNEFFFTKMKSKRKSNKQARREWEIVIL